MAFLDEFGKKAQAYAGVAVDKAKDLAEAAGEKAKAAAESAKISWTRTIRPSASGLWQSTPRRFLMR